jgi:hypothetical protein
VHALIALSAVAQGTFLLRNYSDTLVELNATVFDAEGNPLAGPTYRAELYGAATPDALRPAPTELGKRATVPFLTGRAAGYFGEEAVVVHGVPPPSFAWLQVRAWDSRLGATYEEVVARGVGGYGESPLFYAQSGGEGHIGSNPKYLLGLQSFRLRPATAVLMKGIRREGEQVMLEWQPRFAKYQVQQAGAIEGPWQNVGEPTTATSATNSISGSMNFFRVIAYLE